MWNTRYHFYDLRDINRLVYYLPYLVYLREIT